MRVLLVIAIALSATPLPAGACSCDGTQSIGSVLASAEAVVVGRIKRHAGRDYSSEYPRPAIVVVEITESLKGGLEGDIEVATGQLCYQSFPSEDLRIGMSYVLPLTEIDLANHDDTFGLMIGPPRPNIPSYRMFILPSCSHSALLFDGARLYTSEFAAGGGRQLEYYMNLSVLRFLFATNLFSAWRAMPAIVAMLVLGAGFVLLRKRRMRNHGV
jgi:hypothetical protein